MINRPILSLRWAPEVILALADGPRRYNRLLDAVGVHDRQLTVRLRDLEDAELVERKVDPGPPVRVSYHLTEAGTRFVGPLRDLRAVQEVAISQAKLPQKRHSSSTRRRRLS